MVSATGFPETLDKKKIWLWNSLFWIVLWLFSVWNNYQWAQGAGSPFTWNIVFSWSFPYYITMLLLGPAIFGFYQAWTRKPYLGQALRHLIPAIVSGFLHQLMLNLFFVLFRPDFPGEPVLSFMEKLAARYDVGFLFSINGFLFYWLSIGLIFALDLYQSHRKQEMANMELNAELNRAKFQSLQNQLQPHFLFNTFNSLAMMARQQKHKEVVNMIAMVSNLLRETLNLGEAHKLSLARELELVEHYLQIEQIRFRDRLEIEREIAPETKNCQVPTLFLQPIVENAFRHGISQTEEKGFLIIEARKEAQRLLVSVSNSGPLLPDGWVLDDHLGIGLSNVIKRLSLAFSDNYDLFIANLEDGTGVSVTLNLPCEQA